MPSHTQDDGFHEIQLNGKQLVFLFMAATVVSVVFFLCGVWVGRGVRAERGAGAESASLSVANEPIPQPAPAPPAAPPSAGSDPRAAAPPPPVAEVLSYFNRLEKPNPGPENLKSPAAKPPVPEKPTAAGKPAPVDKSAAAASKPAAPEKPVTAPAAPEKAAPKSDKTTAPVAAVPAPIVAAALPPPSQPATVDPAPAAAASSGTGYAVQIAALNVRTEADAIAKRLTSKGYSAYVVAPSAGTPKVFRVRVGKFPTRKEAESVATKLQKEEQFKPWITR